MRTVIASGAATAGFLATSAALAVLIGLMVVIAVVDIVLFARVRADGLRVIVASVLRTFAMPTPC